MSNETISLQEASRRTGVRPEAVKRILRTLDVQVEKNNLGVFQIPESRVPEIKEEADKIHRRLERASKDVDLSATFQTADGQPYAEMSGDQMRRIREILTDRLDAEVSQRTLGDLLGHQQPTISNYESGHSEIPQTTALSVWLMFDRLSVLTPQEARRKGIVSIPEEESA